MEDWKQLGRILKVDRNTLCQKSQVIHDALVTEQAIFAKVCIEVNLSNVLVKFSHMQKGI